MATAQFGKLIHHIHRVAARQVAPDVTDRQLLEMFTTCRDEFAFAAIVSRHGPMVRRLCKRLLVHEEEVVSNRENLLLQSGTAKDFGDLIYREQGD